MPASHTVPDLPVVRQLPRHGVLCLFGFGIHVSVVNGHISCHDGIGLDRRAFLLSKVNSNLKRLVIIGSDGMISLEALRWIADRDASFYFLDRRGKAIAVCGPSAPSDSKLRRAQALALGNGTALRISRELIRQKLEGQATLVRDMLQSSEAADTIQRFKAEVASAESIDSVRLIESQAAKTYWRSWANLPIHWPHKDGNKVPAHWKTFESRISPLTRSPRLAANPPNAILNLLYGLLESECRIAAIAMGLDSDLGLLHVDSPNRSSLACDLQEPVRVSVDAFLLNWLQSEPLHKSDFWEDRDGNCRLTSSLAKRLCETATTWRRLAAPVAEYVAQALWSSIPKSSSTLVRKLIATRLTQRKKREIKGGKVPVVYQPRPEHACRGCGKTIAHGRSHCVQCARGESSKRMIEVAQLGRATTHSTKAEALRAAARRRHIAAVRAWRSADHPSWLTEEYYTTKIQPALRDFPVSSIASALGVSLPYATDIRAGRRRPHPRHWRVLAQLAGVAPHP